jgi:hypothetical protein
VVFENHDVTAHNVMWPSVGGNRKLAHNLGTFPPMRSASYKFDHPGVVPLLCNIHSEMSAYIVVTRLITPRPTPTAPTRSRTFPPTVTRSRPGTRARRRKPRRSPWPMATSRWTSTLSRIGPGTQGGGPRHVQRYF